jgi:hypothetical protein
VALECQVLEAREMDVVRLIAVVEEGRYKVGIKQRRGWFYGHLVHWYIIWEGKGVGGMKEGVGGGERGWHV